MKLSFFNSILEKIQGYFVSLRLKAKTSKDEKFKARQKMIFMILLMGFIAFLWEKNHEIAPATVQESPKSVDTYIPAGFVLVPIQISNAEALDSMIGAKGVVDLFVPDLKRPGRSKKVAEHIKVLRAPLNPNQFAVLAEESASSALVHYEGAYFAVVQNPKTVGTQFEAPPKRKISSRFIMEDGHETR